MSDLKDVTISVDIPLARIQASVIGDILDTERKSAELTNRDIQALDGVWNLLHGIIDASEK